MNASIKRFCAVIAVSALTSMTACAGSDTRESTGQYVDDATLTTKVKAALVKDSEVKARDINVETFKGVVQLSGFADSQAQIDKALQDARNVDGVKSVKNDLHLKGTQ